ncbi:MAG TPA: DoxX family protein [Bacteroidetes bacterium]|nr:DoxX family protein [Bacteroidota bacterium]
MNKLIEKVFETRSSDMIALILRVTLGAVMFAHGAQKLLGWFGGFGFNGTMDAMTNNFHLPWIVALLVILTESIGGLCLALGFVSRIIAAAIAVIMAGAVVLVHWDNGFFMNWYNISGGEGFEYHLLVIAICAALIFQGGGMYSIDSWIYERFRKRRAIENVIPDGVTIRIREQRVMFKL